MTASDLARMAGVDRGKLRKFESGEDEPSGRWVGQVERALDDFEDTSGFKPGEVAAEAAGGEPIRLTFHDIFGVGEIIAEGPADKPDELIAAVTQLIADLRNQSK